MVKKDERCENHTMKLILLAGFLGAGKTTLLKNIISWCADLSDTAVIVNEFGEVGIDGEIVKNAGIDVIEMVNGCICCSLATDLVQTLADLYENFSVSRILIEATGLAEPHAVVSLLNNDALRDKVKLQGIVSVLDAKFWKARQVMGPLFFNQLKGADIILLNKIDMISQGDVSLFLREIHEVISGCRVIPVRYCLVDPDMFWSVDIGSARKSDLDDYFRDHHLDPEEEGYHEGFVHFSFICTQPMDEDCFRNFLEGLQWEMFRIKGTLRLQDRTVMLNFIGGECSWEAWQDKEETRLSFVGWKIEKDHLLEMLNKCIIEE